MRDLTSINRSRIIGLLKMDLRKMLRGKAFYVMPGIAVIIPVMMLTQMPVENSAMLLGGTDEGTAEVFGGGMMGLSILGALTGILLCIYIGRDYSTGFIKNIVTAHANKLDYIISKELTAIVCSTALYAVYIIALAIAGAVVGAPLKIPDEGGFILYFAEHLISSAAMSALVISINMIFRRLYGWSICFSFYIA